MKFLAGIEDEAKQLAKDLVTTAVGADPWEVEWASNPEPFDPTNLAESGGLSAQGLNFLRLGISKAVDDPDYKPPLVDERTLYMDTDLRVPKCSPKWWRSFSHDVWINSAKYRQELEEANARYFADQAALKAQGPAKIIPTTQIPTQNLETTVEKSKTGMYIGIGVGVVGVIGLALFLIRRK